MGNALEGCQVEDGGSDSMPFGDGSYAPSGANGDGSPASRPEGLSAAARGLRRRHGTGAGGRDGGRVDGWEDEGHDEGPQFAVSEPASPTKVAAAQLTPAAATKIRAAFLRIDTDASGALSRTELLAALKEAPEVAELLDETGLSMGTGASAVREHVEFFFDAFGADDELTLEELLHPEAEHIRALQGHFRPVVEPAEEPVALADPPPEEPAAVAAVAARGEPSNQAEAEKEDDAEITTMRFEVLRMCLTFVVFVILHQAWMYVSRSDPTQPFQQLPPDVLEAMAKSGVGARGAGGW